jgi:hypothetical protein
MNVRHFKVTASLKFSFSGSNRPIGTVIVTGKAVGQNGAWVFEGRSHLDRDAIGSEYGDRTLVAEVERRTVKAAQEAVASYVQHNGKFPYTYDPEQCLETEVKEVA